MSTSRKSDSKPITNQHIRQNRRQQQVNTVQTTVNSSSEEENYIFTINKSTKNPHVDISINTTLISMLIDTGASINIIDKATYDTITSQPELQETTNNAFTYGSKTPIKISGMFTATITSKFNCIDAEFYVVPGNSGCLLSYDTAKQLKLVTIVNNVTPSLAESDKLIAEYPSLFQGIGKLKNFQVKLHIDETVQPVAQPHRRIPFHLRKLLKAELESHQKNDLINKQMAQPLGFHPRF